MPGAIRPPLVLSLIAALGVALLAAACGEADEHAVVEGEPAHLGEVTYNVGLTRFLNPNLEEDGEYLADQPEPPAESVYMGVFLRITNESESEQTIADEFAIVDIQDNRYESLASDSTFALEPGARVSAGGELPPPETALGPAAGSVLLFLVDEFVIDQRPLTLEISGAEGTVEVQLDI